MADFENFQNFNNYQINLEDNIEMRKAITKLGDLVAKKQIEIDNVTKIYQDFKIINEKNRKECQELSQKLAQAYSEKSNTEKKYEAEIQKLKNYYERQREVYEQQIAKLSFQEAETVKNKLALEVDLKYQTVLKEKDLELELANDQLFEWKKKYELLFTEYDTYKSEITREIDILKENCRSEVKELNFKMQLLNEKNELNNDKENLRNLKNELDISRKNAADLQNEIFNLRKEKEGLTKEKFEISLNATKELEKFKLDIAVKTSEYERILNSFKLIESENLNLRNKFDSKNDEIKNLIEEKLALMQSNFTKENYIENLKSENSMLKKKYEERDNEFNQLEKVSIEKDKSHFFKEKKDREDFQNKIDELTNKLRESQIDYKTLSENSRNEITNLKKELSQVIEEKKFFISKFGSPNVKDKNGVNASDSENNLQKVISDLNVQIVQKNKKIEYLLSVINWYKKITGIDYEENFDFNDFENDFDKNGNKSNENALNQKIIRLKETIVELTEKKNYYKSKCQTANEKLKFVLDKFNQAEKLEQNANDLKSNLISQNIKPDSRYDSAKEKDPTEEEYNDFEENISVDSKNWK